MISSQTLASKNCCQRQKENRKGRGGKSGRQTKKKGCLLADAGVQPRQSSSRATLPARRSETEAMYPMKYSAKLSLLKKKGRARGMKMCCDGKLASPKFTRCQHCTDLFTRVGGGRGAAGGPLNVHTNVPLTAHQSPEQRPKSGKFCSILC